MTAQKAADVPGLTAHRPAVLCNPRSGGWIRAGRALEPLARQLAGELYREVSARAGIVPALQGVAAAGADALVVAGGDGTVQAVLDALHEGDWRPPLALVPCGTTNMTALDVGVCGAPAQVLQRLVEYVRSNRPLGVTWRPALRIRDGAGPVRYGMFFGAGLVAAGVRYFGEHLRRPGITGEALSGVVVLRYLAALLAGRGGAGTRAHWRADTGLAMEGNFSVILASTLDRLLMGLRPYWGSETAPVHFTAVRSNAPRLWRRLPALLAGRGVPQAHADHYRSCNLRTLELALQGEYVLDGEIFAATSAAPLHIDATPPLGFLHVP